MGINLHEDRFGNGFLDVKTELQAMKRKKQLNNTLIKVKIFMF